MTTMEIRFPVPIDGNDRLPIKSGEAGACELLRFAMHMALSYGLDIAAEAATATKEYEASMAACMEAGKAIEARINAAAAATKPRRRRA